MKRLLPGLFMVVVLLSVAAMVSAAPRTITITYVNFIGKEVDQVGATIDTYMKANPNVKFGIFCGLQVCIATKNVVSGAVGTVK